jgi:hypothetical protein
VRSDNGDKIYFPINDSVVPFSIHVNNDGNEKVDLLLSKKQIGNKIVVTDANAGAHFNNYSELNLTPQSDTLLEYNASLKTADVRNHRIDVENYSPELSNEEMRNTLFFQSQLSNSSGGPAYSGTRKIDFVRLTDQKTMNPYGSAILPLTMDLNMYNILGVQPVMRMDLRGSTILANQAVLGYQTQFNFTTATYNNQLTRDLFYRFTYTTRKADFQVGNISGGMNTIPISGKGASGSYFVLPNLRVGAYYVHSSLYSGIPSSAYGGFLNYQLKNIGSTTLQYGSRSTDDHLNKNNFANLTTSFRLLPTQQLNFSYAVSRNLYTNETNYKSGNSVSAGYTGSYFKKRLTTNIRGTVFSANYGVNSLPGANYYSRIGFSKTKKWNVFLQNHYGAFKQNTIINQLPAIVENKVLYNQLFFSINNGNTRLMPNVFFNKTHLNNIELLYRGAGFDYSQSNVVKNSRVGVSVNGGYNKLPAYKDIKDYFTMQFTFSAMFNTLSLSSRYFYGPQYINDPQTLQGAFKYPQSLFLSAQKQWQPFDAHFVLQSSVNYSYMNQFNRHILGLYPELYYFTNSKWRFSLSPGYSVNSSKADQAINVYQGEHQSELPPQKVVTESFYLNAGVRKEFGIPVPKKFSGRAFSTITFTTFLDANGNKVKDKNEVVIKDVVIRAGNDEVITNEDGKATFINMASGKYRYSATSLYELNGWFPLIDDSLIVGVNEEINVPFMKGIKLTGGVIFQKEHYSGMSANVDLSRILITAADSSGKLYKGLTDSKGNYVLYIPPGHYLLNMDEGFVGKGFIVLKNNADLKLKDEDSFNYNFYILEKKRKVNIKKFGEENGDIK